MVGALSVVGSSVVETHTCPCLCLDTLTTTHLNLKTGGDLVLHKNSKKNLGKPGSLSSSFIDMGNERRLWPLPVTRSLRKRKQRKNPGVVIVNEVAGQYDDNFDDVETQILNYFTYKAVRTVMNQLYEMNPTQYRWFYDFVAANKPGDGKSFIRMLVKEKQDLAERVMITRLHLYSKWIKKCDHAKIYKEISDENLELMRERLMETVIWPSDDTNTEKIG